MIPGAGMIVGAAVFGLCSGFAFDRIYALREAQAAEYVRPDLCEAFSLAFVGDDFVVRCQTKEGAKRVWLTVPNARKNCKVVRATQQGDHVFVTCTH